jgi:hypothetical protein
VTENSTTFEIDLLVPGLIALLDPKAGIVLWRNHASGPPSTHCSHPETPRGRPLAC